MISRCLADVVLTPSPIDPDWIVSGGPQARSAVLTTSADGGAWTILWECTSGRFIWRYDLDETVHFLEGSVIISGPRMPARRYGPGDTIHFARGSVATWEVEGVIRKIAFCRPAPPLLVAQAMRIARGVRQRLRALKRAPLAGLLVQVVVPFSFVGALC